MKTHDISKTKGQQSEKLLWKERLLPFGKHRDPFLGFMEKFERSQGFGDTVREYMQ